MNTKTIEQLNQGLTTAFIDENTTSSLNFKPQFISNNYKEGRKVIATIEEELFNCDEFFISVAFITMSGIVPLLQTLKELEQRGKKGKILTTDYLTFSEPKALVTLNQFKNIEIKMFLTENSSEGFHTKGYVFKKDQMVRIVVGSSNLTSKAMTINREWNTKLISTEQGEYAKNILSEFNELWNSKQALPYEQFIDIYTTIYQKKTLIQKELDLKINNSAQKHYQLKPNSMQQGFIDNLRKIYDNVNDRALLISATGTGKTYASAFAIRELEFKRVLFLVHRNQIAKQAKEAYRKIFDDKVSMGMITGKHQDFNADFVFATMQTMSKTEILQKYNKDTWDCIIIDEAHHSSAGSYQKIMEYFEPKLWLGMTATPDKRDDGSEEKKYL